MMKVSYPVGALLPKLAPCVPMRIAIFPGSNDRSVFGVKILMRRFCIAHSHELLFVLACLSQIHLRPCWFIPEALLSASSRMRASSRRRYVAKNYC
jgi:hypothetical protein